MAKQIMCVDLQVQRLFFVVALIGFCDPSRSATTPFPSFSETKSSATGKDIYPLILISFDGFRWNYLERTNTPNFNIFRENGVTARYGLRNAFVTKTFPNHFTLVTGLWEESHGIVANDMYDPLLNQSFSPHNVSANEDPAWFSVGAEPIWVTNQLQVRDGCSGVIMWVGGGAPIKWVKPSRFIPFDDTMKNETKVDTLIEWLTDEYPINLGLMYFDQPDGYGHHYGPESAEVTRMIGGLDKVIGYLLQRLQEKRLLEKTNIIITSDHGFTETPEENLINLDQFIDPTTYMLPAMTPIATIWPHNDSLADEIYKNLTEGASKNGNFKVYRKEEVPAYYHYTKNRRISPIVAVAHDTFSFCTGGCAYYERGDHGYDNRLQDMHPFFLAMGPSFKRNFAVDTFDNVDLYPLMCHLLGIKPAPNNGTMKIVSLLLAEKTELHSVTTFVTYIVGIIFIACVAGIFVVAACRYHRYLKRRRRQELTGVTILQKPSGRATLAVTSTQVNGARGSSGGSSSETKSKFSESRVPLLAQEVDEDFS